MSRGSVVLPLPVVEMPVSQTLRNIVREHASEISGDILLVKEDHLTQPFLLVDTAPRSALRILVRSRLPSADKARIKKCCDRACDNCLIPLMSGHSCGYFAGRRLQELCGKKKWRRCLESSDYPEALEHAGIRPVPATSSVLWELMKTVSSMTGDS